MIFGQKRYFWNSVTLTRKEDKKKAIKVPNSCGEREARPSNFHSFTLLPIFIPCRFSSRVGHTKDLKNITLWP